MRAACAVVVIAVIAISPMGAYAQPPIGGASLIPDGPGRYAVQNSLGQRTGTLVESSPGVYQLRDESGRLSDWKWKKRTDGGWDFVPSPFGDKKAP